MRALAWAKVSLALWVMTVAGMAYGQSVGVGTATPNSSAKLDVTSTTQGFLPPRMTTAQRNAIASPAEGLMIYNTDTKCAEFWNGTNWVSTCVSAPPCGKPLSSTASAAANPVCAGSSLVLNASSIAGVTYAWTYPDNTAMNTTSTTLTVTTNATSANAGTYTLRTWANGCYSDPTTVSITVQSLGPWVQKASFTGSARTIPTATLVGTKIYAGFGSGYLNDWYEYNTATDAWTAKASSTKAGVHGPGGFSDGTYAYVAFGYNGAVTNTIARYDPSTNSWTNQTAASTYPTFSGGLVVPNANGGELGGKGYFFGGTNNSGACTNTTYSNYMAVFNPAGGAGGTWSYFQPATAPTWREQPMLFVIGGLIYMGAGQCCGSCGSPSKYTDFWVYDPAANTWTQFASDPYPGTSGAQTAYFSNGSYGYVVDNTTRKVYKFNPGAAAGSRWSSTGTCIPSGPVFNVAVYYPSAGKAYVFDTGTTRQTWLYTPE